MSIAALLLQGTAAGRLTVGTPQAAVGGSDAGELGALDSKLFSPCVCFYVRVLTRRAEALRARVASLEAELREVTVSTAYQSTALRPV